ncbi:hypothetical protein CPB85DRAFT_1387826 [Mucidula mucida]|nr:hypothetical protein CPB85DRAFT_1387826 [Mucidula mucida]
MQVTISLLPTSLSLVHIPRSRLAQLTHPVLHHILQPTKTFLNMTCNEIEMSLFVERSDLAEFEKVARRDRHKRRGSQGSAGGPIARENVEISYEMWSVLQIDSHSDQLDNSGARINELSAPLAAAGISILYQSSYMSDFLFVKKSRLSEALALFSAAGFSLYSPNCPPASPTPAVLTRANSPTGVRADADTGPRSKSHSPHAGQVHVLNSDLTCVGLQDAAAEQWSLKIVKLVAFPDLIQTESAYGSPSPISVSDSDSDSEDGYFSHSPSSDSPLSSATSNSHSRSTSDLPSALKPPSKHLISPLTPLRIDTTPLPPPPPPSIPFFSFTRTAEGSSLTTDVRVLAALFPETERHMVICGGELDFLDQSAHMTPEDDDDSEEEETGMLRCLQIDLRRFGLDKHGLVNRFSRVLEQANINHMYSSTVKTANLLVEKRHALRAQALLRSC